MNALIAHDTQAVINFAAAEVMLRGTGENHAHDYTIQDCLIVGALIALPKPRLNAAELKRNSRRIQVTNLYFAYIRFLERTGA